MCGCCSVCPADVAPDADAPASDVAAPADFAADAVAAPSAAFVEPGTQGDKYVIVTFQCFFSGEVYKVTNILKKKHPPLGQKDPITDDYFVPDMCDPSLRLSLCLLLLCHCLSVSVSVSLRLAFVPGCDVTCVVCAVCDGCAHCASLVLTVPPCAHSAP
jgi:hypothetical protein